MPAAGDPIYASDITLWRPRYYVKGNLTSRLSTVTLTADPDLAGIPLEVGTFEIELVLYFTLASAAAKLTDRWGFTGTISDTIRLCHGPGSAQVAGPQDVTEATVRGYALTSQSAIYDASTSTAYSAVLEKAAVVQVTVAGNLSLNWAQGVSTASNTNVQAGSYFKIQKVS